MVGRSGKPASGLLGRGRQQADGFDIALTKEAPRDDASRLFFVNVGGYDPAQFTELHKNILLVVPDARTAKARAKAEIRTGWQPHKDRLFEVEKAVDLTARDAALRIFATANKGQQRKAFRVRVPISVDRQKASDDSAPLPHHPSRLVLLPSDASTSETGWGSPPSCLSN